MRVESDKMEIQVKQKDKLLKFLQSYAMIVVLVVIWVIFQLATGSLFLSSRNLSNIMRQIPISGILSVGMGVCIITGNIDLSVGSVAGFLAAICGIMMTNMGINAAVAILTALVIGAVIGAYQGFLIAYQGIPPFIVTLGGLMIFKGGMLLLTDNSSIQILDEAFNYIGSAFLPVPVGYAIGAVAIVALIGYFLNNRAFRKRNNISVPSIVVTIAQCAVAAVLIIALVVVLNTFQGVPFSLVLLMLILLLFTFILSKSKYGRKVYAVGGNPVAARLAGIHVERVVLITYIIVGIFSGLTGVVMASRLGGAPSNGGNGFELDAISICALSGISLAGGRGRLPDVLIGTLIMVSLTNGMSLLDMQQYQQMVAKGIVLLLAVLFDVTVRNARK